MHLHKKYILLFVLLSIPCVLLQTQTIQTKLSKKYIKIFNSANIHISESNYKIAEEELNEIIFAYPRYVRAYVALAGMYSAMKSYESALQQYKIAMNLDFRGDEFYYLSIAICFSGFGKFDSAKHYLNEYKKRMNPKLIDSKKIVKLEKNFDFAMEYAKKYQNEINQYDFKVHNLGDSINSEFPDYFPSLNFDNTKILFTRRIFGLSIDLSDSRLSEEEVERLTIEKKNMEKVENEDFYESILIHNKWSNAKPLAGKINSISNEGGSNLSINGKYLYFTGCNFEDTKGSCDIYVSKYEKEGWSKAENLSENINSEFWESQPSLSADERMLFFASRRPGGFGGSDLYVSYKKKQKWSDPINLGPNFNTAGDEIAPFIHSDNRTLYFASDGLQGYGKLDLFVAKRIGSNQWATPKSMGYPVNSIENESNIIISSDGKTALFSSDKGDSRRKMDLFQFELRKDLQPFKTYLVKKHLISTTGFPFQTTILKVYDIQDSFFFSEPEVDSFGRFEIYVAKNRNYLININGKNIFYQYDTLDTKKDIELINLKPLLPVKEIKVGEKKDIQKIFFEPDSFYIQPASFFELNSLVEMLEINPHIKIKITGYTDDSGDKEYNLELSKKRAFSVYKYLINKKISPKCLSWQGLGQMNPIGDNTQEHGKSLNRRIEIEILSID